MSETWLVAKSQVTTVCAVLLVLFLGMGSYLAMFWEAGHMGNLNFPFFQTFLWHVTFSVLVQETMQGMADEITQEQPQKAGGLEQWLLSY